MKDHRQFLRTLDSFNVRLSNSMSNHNIYIDHLAAVRLLDWMEEAVELLREVSKFQHYEKDIGVVGREAVRLLGLWPTKAKRSKK